VFKKKPWSDGLFPDFDDSFESRFYCFGGDGGGDSGSGGRNEPRQNRYNPADQEPEESRAAPPPTLPTPPPARPVPTRPTPPPARPYEPEPYEGPFTSQIAENIYMSGADAPPPTLPTPPPARPMGIADMFPSAVVEPADVIDAKNTRTTDPTKISFTPSLPDFSVNIGSPTDVQDVYEDAISLGNTGLSVRQLDPPSGRTVGSLADLFGVPDTVNIGGYDVRFKPDVNLENKRLGLTGTIKFAQGGIVSLLQPLGDYLTGEIDQQRVDPFLEMVENAAYQEFGIDPSSGGGGMEFVDFELPGETFGPGQMKPQVGFEEPVLNVQPGKYISGNELTVSTGFQGRPALQEMPGYRGPPTVGGNMSGEQMMTGHMADYRQAQEDARRQRESGFMGRMVLPGEMSFEDFMGMQPQVNLLQDSATPFQAQFQSAFGGIGSLF
tara:strand:- start:162 stop:1475 length:1314 start_codon:yes stop_codon:yes gene_type:complete